MSKSITVSSCAYIQTDDIDPERHVNAGPINDAMEAAGLDPASLTVVESYDHLPTSGGAGAEVALEHNPRITALMCTADVLALSAMDHLRARGIYVPGQITVTGFDGVPEARRVAEGRATSGRDWIGLVERGDYVVTGVREIPLLPIAAVLLVSLGALMLAWRREGQ